MLYVNINFTTPQKKTTDDFFPKDFTFTKDFGEVITFPKDFTLED